MPVPLHLPDSATNVFSPNNDGRNDMFNPYIGKTHLYDATGHDILFNIYMNHYYYYAKDYKLEVYNRWGMLMYTSTDVKSGWDGKYNGKDAPEGVYYWVTSYVSRCLNDETPIQSKGFVHLFRGK
jgi:gliding motility-associated-like protein